MFKQLAIVAALWCSVAHSQTPNAAPIDFPDGAQAPNAAQLAEQLGGKLYTAKLFDGVTWRMEYQASGYVFVNLSTGPRDSGTWRTEDGRVCIEFRGPFPSGCTEYRLSGNTLYLKRSSTGEVVALQKQ
jgi:hypothetical protein